MNNKFPLHTTSLVAFLLTVSAVNAAEFRIFDDKLKATWTTDMTLGGGIRLKNPSCSLTGDPTSFGCGSGANV
ncbi:DUF1302 family protein, partial [Massilia orientalis]